MPTLEERTMESDRELKARIDARSRELGITHTFSNYMEMMETYLLKLEFRVKQLEEHCNIDSDDIMND